jgi:hypothetical protein
MAHEPGNPPNLSFADIHKQERDEIQKRRVKQSYHPEDRDKPTFVGLALSGGGIRSATFCLGFLQGLHSLRLLRVFDYLSTVSGGGYLGGWWSAWLSRSEESVRDISAEPYFDVNDIHQPISLLTKISEAADPVCQTLLDQLQADNAGRSFLETLRKRKLIESPQLSEVLVYHLNTYILNHSKFSGKTGSKEELETTDRRAADLAWEARVHVMDTFPYELRDIFPPSEKIEPERPRSPQEQSSDGSRCAWEDPVHHLRLFANYLTPRKGILSADTWRAISVVARNLAFTWLILLPLLIGVMLLGQAYFLLNPVTSVAFTNPHSTDILGAAFIQILIPVGVLVASGVLISIAWLLCNRDNSSSQDSTVQTTCLLALLALLAYAVASITPLRNWFDRRLQVREHFFSNLRNSNLDLDTLISIVQLRLMVSWAIVLVGSILFMWYWKLADRSFPIADSEALARWKRDVRRSRFSRAQAMLLVITAIVAVVLLLSWLSCALAYSGSPLKGWKIPFAIVPLLSIAGSIYTALRATPLPNADKATSREPTRVSKLIFAATPPLVVAVLAVIAAWFSHWLLAYYMSTGTNSLGIATRHLHFWDIRGFLKFATILSIALCMLLALYEMQNLKWYKILRRAWAPILFVCLLMSNLNWAGQAIFGYVSEHSYVSETHRSNWTLLISAALGVIITLLVFNRVIPRGKWKWRLFRRLNLVNKTHKGNRQRHLKIIRKLRIGSVLVGLGLSAALGFIGYLIGMIIHSSTTDYRDQGALLRAGVVTFVGLAGGLILFRLLITRRRNNARERVIELYFFSGKSFGKRPAALWLTASICITLPIALLSVAHWLAKSHPPYSFTQAPSLFPICIGVLFVSLMWLRSLVIQKSLISKKPLVGWSGGIVDWLLGRVARVEKDRGAPYQLLAFVAACLAPFTDIVIRTLSPHQFATSTTLWPVNWEVSVVALFVSLPLFGASVFKIPVKASLYKLRDGARLRFFHGQTFLWILASFCILLAFIAGLLFLSWIQHISEITMASGFATVLLPVASGCFLMVLFEFSWGQRDNRRSLYLIAFAYSALASIFFVRLAGAGAEWQIVPGMLAAICVWVGALGWMVDPNAVSMHQFYKGRLVRAYLGASNVRRLMQRKKEITETVAGDDFPLKSLRNCERGGPYHIVNTTLNLVAGRDLATAQRSASSFVLSQKYCGSARTHYCSTEQYMNGQLTLGTAVAASGAAVSPNMGAKKPTAALAMLMTLLNVRLGYWAPTPNGEGWNSSQPRLWPFYLVREFLSQTNDLSDYCYLTDGGHFDNTGLYSLIERGCRYVVLVDCGADPKPSCFEDFGEAIRRCRIDFGTEIELNLDPFIQTNGGKGDQCFAVGKIHFSKEHLLSLEHTSEDSFDEKSLTGKIVYFKPAVMGDVTPDVRQYGLENRNFPQQGTANQWFDEAQFESYRRLGELCANRAFDSEHVQNMSKLPEVFLRDIDTLFEDIGNTDAPQKISYSLRSRRGSKAWV